MFASAGPLTTYTGDAVEELAEAVHVLIGEGGAASGAFADCGAVGPPGKELAIDVDVFAELQPLDPSFMQKSDDFFV